MPLANALCFDAHEYLGKASLMERELVLKSLFLLQTPLLLTPSPLLSNIHFWSTLSPVAPLSPARRQGAHTLFQVSHLNSTYLLSRLPFSHLVQT